MRLAPGSAFPSCFFRFGVLRRVEEPQKSTARVGWIASIHYMESRVTMVCRHPEPGRPEVDLAVGTDYCQATGIPQAIGQVTSGQPSGSYPASPFRVTFGACTALVRHARAHHPHLYLIGNERKGALSKAEHYRFLNEPWEAESICREVLAIDPANQTSNRQAIAEFRRPPDWRSCRQAHILFQNAMESYRHAWAIRPPDNDDAVLRWNACVRFLERNGGLQ